MRCARGSEVERRSSRRVLAWGDGFQAVGPARKGPEGAHVSGGPEWLDESERGGV